MSALQFSEDDNVGGVQQIQLAPAYAFISLTPAVAFRDGYTWDEALILPDSAQLTDESAETDNGPQYTCNLSFAFNKKRADLMAALQPYIGTVGIAKVTDQNGLVLIIGNLETPVTFKVNSDSGKRPSDVNSIAISGSVVSRFPALQVA